ncbi:hypothetical protein NITMOv2_3817 [Nitrospira moscoviensis]|uniref:Uncharacterized protein n=1 Tax=Nitrospira moscoviensis TaxID=42253 RepID=A0A0K2GHU9_NITMO|nr:hypothetical protein NITMOv2_3817 [Nitrospira moscoviensis]
MSAPGFLPSGPLPWAPRLLGTVLLCTWLAGCAHTIQVDPLPATPAATRIPRAVQLVVGPLSLEGADHMPGITLLKWPHRDLSEALLRYVERRETFASVSAAPADLAMSIVTNLSMRSRQRYRYRVRLEIEMRDGATPIKTYRAEHEAEGSSVRWVTASDRDPIQAALQQALDDAFGQIEADHALYAAGPRSK